MKPLALAGVLMGLATLVVGIPVDDKTDTTLTSVNAQDGFVAGGACSTPNLTRCLSNEPHTVFKCNHTHQWEVYRECGTWCCRVGLHGYPDCYEQCDTSTPPGEATLPEKTSKRDESDLDVWTDAHQQATEAMTSCTILGDPCPEGQKCCVSLGGPICWPWVCSPVLLDAHGLFAKKIGADTSKRDESSLDLWTEAHEQATEDMVSCTILGDPCPEGQKCCVSLGGPICWPWVCSPVLLDAHGLFAQKIGFESFEAAESCSAKGQVCKDGRKCCITRAGYKCLSRCQVNPDGDLETRDIVTTKNELDLGAAQESPDDIYGKICKEQSDCSGDEKCCPLDGLSYCRKFCHGAPPDLVARQDRSDDFEENWRCTKKGQKCGLFGNKRCCPTLLGLNCILEVFCHSYDSAAQQDNAESITETETQDEQGRVTGANERSVRLARQETNVHTIEAEPPCHTHQDCRRWKKFCCPFVIGGSRCMARCGRSSESLDSPAEKETRTNSLSRRTDPKLLPRDHECTPGQKACMSDNQYVMVCEASGVWTVEKKCKAPGCCRSDRAGGPCCGCKGDTAPTCSLKDLLSAADNNSKRDGLPAETAHNPSTEIANDYGLCDISGVQSCREHNRILVICSPMHHWIESADCGCDGSCQPGPRAGTSYCSGTCWGPGQNAADSEESLLANARDEYDSTLVEVLSHPVFDRAASLEHEKAKETGILSRAFAGECTPGSYRCANNDTEIQVCKPDGEWTLSAKCDCGDPGCCKAGPTPNTFFCAPSAKATAQQSSVKRQDVPVDNCHPNDYRCSVSGDAILVCNSIGKWELSALCPGGAGHCHPGSIPSTFFCTSASGFGEIEKRESSNSLRSDDPSDVDIAHALQKLNDAGECEPGTFTCDYEYRLLAVCDATGRWILSAVCGCKGCCVQGPVRGTAYCLREPGMKKARTLDNKGARDLQALSGRSPEMRRDRECTPGDYRCGESHWYLWVCDATGTWKVSAICACEGCCIDGPPGTAYCVQSPVVNGTQSLEGNDDQQSDASDFPRTVTVGDQECTPGEYTCDTTFTVVGVCDATGHWKLSAICACQGCCVFGETPGTAYCVQGPTANNPRSLPTSDIQESDMIDFSSTDIDLDGICIPGTYTCSVSQRLLAVCDVSGHWQVSAICACAGCCIWGETEGTAYCVQRSSQSKIEETPQLHTARDVEAKTVQSSNFAMIPQPPETNGDCEPGCYTCDSSYRYLAVCTPAAHWMVTNDCGRQGACKLGATRCTSFCIGEQEEPSKRFLSL